MPKTESQKKRERKREREKRKRLYNNEYLLKEARTKRRITESIQINNVKSNKDFFFEKPPSFPSSDSGSATESV